MRKAKMRIIAMLMIILSVFMLSGCTKKTSSDKASGKYTYEGSLKLTGLDEEFEVAFNDLYAMETVTKDMTNLTSDGEVKKVNVTGVKLNDILASKNISQKDFETIRLIAGDGYSIDVPKDIISEKDIVLAFEFDGQSLEKNVQPIRAAIDDVRSMYWTSNLVKINFVKNEGSDENAASSGKKIIFIETAKKSLEEQEYTYYESADKAIKVDDLFKKYIPKATSDVNFVAADGFEKSEESDILLQGFIKTTGKDIPLFSSPELPKGMQVKNILSLTCGDTSFLSAANSLKNFTSRDVKNKTGAAIDEVIKAGNLKADSYIFTSSDGYNVEISKKDLDKGIIYEDKDGVYSVKFSEELPKSTNVKDVISVEVGKGENMIAAEGSSDSKSDAKPWEITFEGLSDGSFVLGNDKAKSKLSLVSVKATKKSKSGEESIQAWDGYKVVDALEFLHVKDFKSIKVVAIDGYESEFTKDQVDDTMILGVTVDGENLSKETNLVQLVSKNLASTKWIKGVGKIIVNQ